MNNNYSSHCLMCDCFLFRESCNKAAASPCKLWRCVPVITRKLNGSLEYIRRDQGQCIAFI